MGNVFRVSGRGELKGVRRVLPLHDFLTSNVARLLPSISNVEYRFDVDGDTQITHSLAFNTKRRNGQFKKFDLHQNVSPSAGRGVEQSSYGVIDSFPGIDHLRARVVRLRDLRDILAADLTLHTAETLDATVDGEASREGATSLLWNGWKAQLKLSFMEGFSYSKGDLSSAFGMDVAS